MLTRIDGIIRCGVCGAVYGLAGELCRMNNCPECDSHSWTIQIFEQGKIAIKQETDELWREIARGSECIFHGNMAR